MRLTPIVAAGAALFFSAWTAGPAIAGEPTMALADVRPGMSCSASSVVSGLEPVDFGAQVISVEGATPQTATIVMRFSGTPIAESGIGQGFSGSPVRCLDAGGTPRIIGAIAYGIGQYDNLVGGVTPIEAMLSMPTRGNAPKVPVVGKSASSKKKKATSKKASKQPKRQATRARLQTKSAVKKTWGAGRPPLQLSGLRGSLVDRFAAAAERGGRTLLAAPAARRAQAPTAGALKPGDAVAATSVLGDVGVSAIGTVTYVDGARVWAFGHPVAGQGAARQLLERAQISTVISSPSVGDQTSFKVGSPVWPVGTLGFDGSFGIAGELGATPAMIGLTASVKSADGKTLGGTAAQVVDEREVRGGTTAELLALAAAANAGGAIQRVTQQDIAGGAARVCTTIFLRGEAVPLYQCSDSVVPRPGAEGGVETGVADAVSRAVAPATSAERFTRLVENVRVEITLRDEADTVAVQRLRLPSSVRAGSSARVRVAVVQGSTGERREITVRVKIPRSAAGRRVAIVVFAQSAPSGGEEMLEELFDDEQNAAPRSLPLLRAQYTDAGISGLRAIALPGLSPSQAEELISGGADEGEVSDEDYADLMRQMELVEELPTVRATGVASGSLRARR